MKVSENLPSPTPPPHAHPEALWAERNGFFQDSQTGLSAKRTGLQPLSILRNTWASQG